MAAAEINSLREKESNLRQENLLLQVIFQQIFSTAVRSFYHSSNGYVCLVHAKNFAIVTRNFSYKHLLNT